MSRSLEEATQPQRLHNLVLTIKSIMFQQVAERHLNYSNSATCLVLLP